MISIRDCLSLNLGILLQHGGRRLTDYEQNCKDKAHSGNPTMGVWVRFFL